MKKKIFLLLFCFVLLGSSAWAGYITIKKQNHLVSKAKSSTLHSSKAGKQLCIFYAWSSSVNGANGNVTKAVQEYQKCHVIVLGAGMESKTHGDHAKTKQIISMLKWSNPKTEVYGYINIGVNTTNTSIITLQKEVKEWKGMGVTGIFVDEAGYDYQVTRKRQLDVMNFIHSKGMNVFANAWNMQDVLSPYDEKRKLSKQPLQKGDWVLLEDLFAGFSSFDKGAFQRIQTVQKEAGKQGVRVAGVSTVKQSTECLTNQKIAQYGWMASYLFDIEAFQCSDMFFGSQNEKLITYPSGFLGLSGQTKWLTIQPTQTKKSWVRETKNEKYVLDKATFAFSKERK